MLGEEAESEESRCNTEDDDFVRRAKELHARLQRRLRDMNSMREALAESSELLAEAAPLVVESERLLTKVEFSVSAAKTAEEFASYDWLLRERKATNINEGSTAQIPSADKRSGGASCSREESRTPFARKTGGVCDDGQTRGSSKTSKLLKSVILKPSLSVLDSETQTQKRLVDKAAIWDQEDLSEAEDDDCPSPLDSSVEAMAELDLEDEGTRRFNDRIQFLLKDCGLEGVLPDVDFSYSPCEGQDLGPACKRLKILEQEMAEREYKFRGSYFRANVQQREYPPIGNQKDPQRDASGMEDCASPEKQHDPEIQDSRMTSSTEGKGIRRNNDMDTDPADKDPTFFEGPSRLGDALREMTRKAVAESKNCGKVYFDKPRRSAANGIQPRVLPELLWDSDDDSTDGETNELRRLLRGSTNYWEMMRITQRMGKAVR